jgi:hypothetical protein
MAIGGVRVPQGSRGVAAHIWRLAQENRLLRFCSERDIDPNDSDVDQLAPILDGEGKIVPDLEDIDAVR